MTEPCKDAVRQFLKLQLTVQRHFYNVATTSSTRVGKTFISSERTTSMQPIIRRCDNVVTMSLCLLASDVWTKRFQSLEVLTYFYLNALTHVPHFLFFFFKGGHFSFFVKVAEKKELSSCHVEGSCFQKEFSSTITRHLCDS